MKETLINIASIITACGVIIGAMTKLLAHYFKPLHNRDRKQLRYTIVAFASSLRQGSQKTRDEFLAVFELIDEYKEICEKYNIKNHLFEEEEKYINARFQELDIYNKGRDNK